MTQQQIEERKAEQEVFNHLRAIRRKNRKMRESMGNEAYEEHIEQICRKAEEDYCREHPGVRVVKVGGGYILKSIDGSSLP
jgi:hypothetical protein